MHVPNKVQEIERRTCALRLQRCAAAATLTIALLAEMHGATFASALAAPPININGSHVSIVGLERNNSVFVPVRGFFEKLGAKVTGSGSSLVATRDGKELARMTVGSRNATVNGSSETLPVAPFLAGGVAMLPLRAISEAAGATVTYVPSPRAVDVTRPSGGSMAGAAAAGAAAATVAQAAAPVATDVASAAPVAAAQTNDSGIPWWVWLLLALLLLGLIFWLLTRRKKEPIITTTSGTRANEPTVTTTTRKGNGTDPTINTRK